MVVRKRSAFLALLPFSTALLSAFAGEITGPAGSGVALAQPAPPQPTTPPDDSVLGTVEVNGSASGLPPLPKLGVLPLVTSSNMDSVVQLVVRHDFELSGQFDVLSESDTPAGSYLRDSPVDLRAWKEKKAEVVLRVLATSAGPKSELLGEAYLIPHRLDAKAEAEAPKPVFSTKIQTTERDSRAAMHRLVDQLLGALTGRPGGFASQMTYAARVGKWQQVKVIDSDGFNLHPVGPSNQTIISPVFGPGHELFYAISRDFTAFRLAYGADATPVPMNVPGSIMGLAFSSDRQKLALTVMSGGESTIYTGTKFDLKPTPTAPFANHPVFGPLGKMAYIAGSPVQRVYVDGRAISPPGFTASAPVFCDTPQGLLVVYGVGVAAGADIISMDSSGGAIRRLTQHQGANTFPACSPDGRLIAFFSNAKTGKGPGLYVMPIQRPWLAKKISNEVGDSLHWDPLPPPPH
jgi:TolB protein